MQFFSIDLSPDAKDPKPRYHWRIFWTGDQPWSPLGKKIRHEMPNIIGYVTGSRYNLDWGGDGGCHSRDFSYYFSRGQGRTLEMPFIDAGILRSVIYMYLDGRVQSMRGCWAVMYTCILMEESNRSGSFVCRRALSLQSKSQPGRAPTHALVPIGQLAPAGPDVDLGAREDRHRPVQTTRVTFHLRKR